MPSQDGVRLHYFNARGRAQFLRAFLTVRGVEFHDERIPLDEGFATWQAMRDDRARTGPLKRLPVLYWREDTVPETLVIADFLHRALGDADALGEATSRHHDVIISCAYTDLILPLGMVLWGDLIFPGVDMAKFAESSLSRMQRTLDVLDQSLAEWGWADTVRDRPVTVADCVLWETLDQAAIVFGDRLALGARPVLAKLHAEHPARETFDSLLAAESCQITGRPGERATIEGIHRMLGA